MSEFYFQTYKRRISSLHRDIACEGVAYLPQESGGGFAADYGKLMHTKVENKELPVVEQLIPRGPVKDSRNGLPSDWVMREESYALIRDDNDFRRAPTWMIKHLATAPHIMTGHADIVTEPAVADYKTGKNIEPYVWRQLAGYAAIENMHRSPKLDVLVHQLYVIHHPMPARARVSDRGSPAEELVQLTKKAEKTPVKLVPFPGTEEETSQFIVDTYNAMTKVISREYSPIHDFTPGGHCKFCPGRFSCPEYPGHVRELDDNFFALKELRERGL